MRKKIIILLFVLVTLICAVGTTSLAGSLDTGKVGSLPSTSDKNDSSTNNKANWEESWYNMGTRYVFRLGTANKDDKLEDIPRTYFINQTNYSASDYTYLRYGNGYILMSNSADGTGLFEAVPNTASKWDLYKSNNENATYRYITKWQIFARSNTRTPQTTYLDNFGLTENDVNKLADKVIARATTLKNAGDDGAQDIINKMNQVKKREIYFDIRAEILLGYGLKPTGTTTVATKRFGTKLDVMNYGGKEDDNGRLPFYFTYNELLALNPPSYYVDWFDSFKTALFEKDSKYLKEYGSTETIYEGWDYVRSNILDVEVHYKDRDTNKSIKASTNVKLSNNSTTISKADISGYSYYGVQKNEDAINTKATNVSIKSIDGVWQVIFWYEKSNTNTVKVEFRVDDGTKEGMSVNNKAGNKAGTFTITADTKYTYLDPAFLGGNYTYTGYTKDGGNLTNSNSVTVTYEKSKAKETKIIFWYKSTVDVNWVAVWKMPIASGVEATGAKIPYKKSIEHKEIEGYKYLGEYEIKYGTSSFTGKTDSNVQKAEKATVDVSYKNNYCNQALVVFYYEPEYTLTVNHVYVDPITGNTITVSGFTSDYPIVPNIVQNISSKVKAVANAGYDGCINFGYALNSNAKVTNNAEYLKQDEYVYEYVNSEPTANATLTFYYTKQILNISWEDTDGNKLKEDKKVTIPASQAPGKIDNYTYIKYELDGATTPGGDANTSISVTVKNGGIERNLVFIYNNVKPSITPKPDPNQGSSTQNEILDVNDMNNQKIGQDNNKRYWVLDEKGTATLNFRIENVTDLKSIDAKIEIPFDVYYDSKFVKSGTPIEVKNISKTNGNNYVECQATLTGIIVPIWTNEQDYTIKANITVKYGDSNASISQNAECDVTVVGRVYDFSVTNLEGDTNWKNVLFNSNATKGDLEHDADTLPIGQGTQQSSKWAYGITKGSKVYFSINTKGSKNTSIKITPKFFYNNGQDGKLTEVDVYYSNGKKITSDDIIVYGSTNEFRQTAEYKTDKQKALSIYGSNIYTGKISIGNYGKIVLSAASRFPYTNYLVEFKNNVSTTLPTGYNESTLLKEASHWYGEFMIPANAQYVAKGKTATQAEFDKYKTGSLIVYFNIITCDEKGNEYLAYNLYSPKSQNGNSEWIYEKEEMGGNNTNSYTLPKLKASDTLKSTTAWFNGKTPDKDGSAPVIIYGTTSTNQNYETVGTH